MLLVHGSTGTALWKMSLKPHGVLAAHCVNDGYEVASTDNSDAAALVVLGQVITHTLTITGPPTLVAPLPGWP